MELARTISTWSKDPRTKVGSVIVDSSRRVVGMGYNGFPRGVDDNWRDYADRDSKLPRVVHAELNAILNSVQHLEGKTLYATKAPCTECAKAIIQSGITRAVFPLDGVDDITLEMFDQAGVDFNE